MPVVNVIVPNARPTLFLNSLYLIINELELIGWPKVFAQINIFGSLADANPKESACIRFYLWRLIAPPKA